ncbi:hypothetical protein [Polaribacter sp. Z022]|uniref:hypothetical protein n=1 Tax=Polaribacter sp. Z022 TaxID=2927125 RepID=UPI00201FE41C|nr:hypothetical protein [Polaribacter sp. Z022]MCL7755008.1 hypothetical protein [Polaribacter sp. Z022]
MKKNITILLFLTIIFSCSKKEDNFSKYEWILHYEEYNKDYTSSTPQQKVLFKNDSIVCVSELNGKTTKFPLIKKDSLIIFKELYTITKNDRKKKDTIVTDTLLFEFKTLFKKPLLIIKPLNSEHYNILTTSNAVNSIEETNNFLSIVNFKIGGFEIGDSISLNNFENIKDANNFENINLLVAYPKNDKNIELEIIDKKYIFSIKQKNIEKSQIENIVKVINEKIKMNPDTIKEGKPFYTKGYTWDLNGVQIILKNEDMYKYYIDLANNTKENDLMGGIYKSASLKQAYKNSEKSKYYELEYKNKILQEILKTISNEKPQSSIIE